MSSIVGDIVGEAAPQIAEDIGVEAGGEVAGESSSEFIQRESTNIADRVTGGGYSRAVNAAKTVGKGSQELVKRLQKLEKGFVYGLQSDRYAI
jgi:hypothetical protein